MALARSPFSWKSTCMPFWCCYLLEITHKSTKLNGDVSNESTLKYTWFFLFRFFFFFLLRDATARNGCKAKCQREALQELGSNLGLCICNWRHTCSYVDASFCMLMDSCRCLRLTVLGRNWEVVKKVLQPQVNARMQASWS